MRKVAVVITSRASFPEKFCLRVATRPNGCWDWTGAKDKHGYGYFYQGKMWRAARFAYQCVKGDIPSGLTIDHLCRNTSCVNPSHLEAVTDRTNILRGTSFSARHVRKTHCVHGHELSDSNVYRHPLKSGSFSRVCRPCIFENKRKHRALQKVAS